MNILSQILSIITDADSYKIPHWDQYPEGTTHISSYIEARSSQYAKELGSEYDYAEFFGLQAYLKDTLAVPIDQYDIDLAEEMSEWHFSNKNFFNKAGWQYILDHHQGKLPVEIRALPEGTVLPTGNALLEIVNTDPRCAWLTSYVETSLLRASWYTTTTATKSRIGHDIIKGFMDKTSDNPAANIITKFMLHDFGSRGTTSQQAAALGGMSHLVNFQGTDTVAALFAVLRYYEPEFEAALARHENPKAAMLETIRKLKAQGVPCPGASVEASEHSTMTILGRTGEKSQIKKLIDKAKEGRIVSIVSDSYDYFDAVENLYGGEFKDDIIEAGKKGGKIVIRPDSGEPVDVVLRTLEILERKFGCTVNAKGYKVLPPYIGVLQGDGITLSSLNTILQAMEQKGYSAENLVFGMGGGLLQRHNRDDLNMAQKANAACINGVWYDVYKDPETSKMSFKKQSKRGRLSVVWDGVAFTTKRTADLQPGETDRLGVVYRNGDILKEWGFGQVRKFAEFFTGLNHTPPAAPIDDPWQRALE